MQARATAKAPAQVRGRLAAGAVVGVLVRTLAKGLEMQAVGQAQRAANLGIIVATANQENSCIGLHLCPCLSAQIAGTTLTLGRAIRALAEANDLCEQVRRGRPCEFFESHEFPHRLSSRSATHSRMPRTCGKGAGRCGVRQAARLDLCFLAAARHRLERNFPL
jgi:hypothetical protein